MFVLRHTCRPRNIKEEEALRIKQSAYNYSDTGVKEFLFDIKQTYILMKYLFKKVLNFLFISVQNPLYNEILSMHFLGCPGCKKYMIDLWAMLWGKQFIQKLFLSLKYKWLEGNFF